MSNGELSALIICYSIIITIIYQLILKPIIRKKILNYKKYWITITNILDKKTYNDIFTILNNNNKIKILKIKKMYYIHTKKEYHYTIIYKGYNNLGDIYTLIDTLNNNKNYKFIIDEINTIDIHIHLEIIKHKIKRNRLTKALNE